MSRARSDLKVTASDALEFEAIQSDPPKRRRGLKWVVWGGAFVTVLGGGGIIFGDVLMRLAVGNGNDVPLIRAADGPFKVRPENPGGLQIPDRDKLVYEHMQPGVNTSFGGSVVERLLPQPEKPMPKPAPEVIMPSTPPTRELGASNAERVHSPLALPISPVPGVKDVVSVQPPLLPPAPLTNSQPHEAPLSLRKNLERPAQPAPTSTPRAQAKVAPTNVAPTNDALTDPSPIPSDPVAAVSTFTYERQAPERRAAVPTKTPNLPMGGSFRVQLAAARTPKGAQSEWNRIRRKHLDLLGDLRLKVTKADLGPKKGVFYRLRVGPLPSVASARTLCKELSKRKMGCLVVKPGR